MNRRDALKQSHLVKAAIEESVDLRLVKGQLLHLSSVVQTEVHQVFPRRCSGVEENTNSGQFPLLLCHTPGVLEGAVFAVRCL